MKDIIIVGAGSAARDVLQVLKEINKVEKKWNIKGFIADYGVDIKALTSDEYEIIGTIEDWQPNENEEFVCAVADPDIKRKLIGKLETKGAKFAQVIHPNVEINDYCKIGKGVILYHDAILGPNCEVGDYVHTNSKIGHDCKIGDYSTVSIMCAVMGHVTMGQGVFVGGGATIIPGVTIGDHVYVGAGSVVIKDIEENKRVFGNPAREMR
ncbi:acetyltransferase [Drancourtella massiliensis]|uniref:Acetyltransferase n=1 Tax=Drancourtella massiliensis TaxID=1632013 RepID=A0ABS2ED71_9FIRM|nr:acetyltransferase [Drancourtella massiliensis]MBM6742877.1 acetyltransferase [Drancourtella massiliensis]